MAEVEERIKELVFELAPEWEGDLPDSARLSDDLELDSITVVNLLSNVESAFGLLFV